MTAHSEIKKTIELCAIIADRYAYQYRLAKDGIKECAAKEIAQGIRDILK